LPILVPNEIEHLATSAFEFVLVDALSLLEEIGIERWQDLSL
jgi:hypothetical protein